MGRPGEDGAPGEDLRLTNTMRLEKTIKEAQCRERSLASLQPYLAQVNTYKARSHALDHSKLLQDPKVQDWASLTGTRRSLPTNISDAGPRVNVNMLRYKRDTDYVSTTPYDGGATYNDEVCVNNWVEERRDRSYKSGFVPRELHRAGGRFDTEYVTRFKPSSSEYTAQLMETYNTTRFSGLSRVGSTGVAATTRSGKATDSQYDAGYARDGFGRGTHQDHTPEARRGSFWVGTAPRQQFDTITHSTMRSETLEFQNRCASEDPRSKILLGNKPLVHESERTLRIREGLEATKPWPRTWQTIYQSEHRDFSRRPATVA